MLTVAGAVMAGTVAVGIRSATAMERPAHGEATSVTYTGCVESVNHGYAFLLTNVDVADAMHRDVATQQHDGMAARNGNMAMKDDAGKPMPPDQSTMADPKMEAMSPKSFGLAGSASFSRHVGQKVSVTGTLADAATRAVRQDMATITVKNLKVLAKSCS